MREASMVQARAGGGAEGMEAVLTDPACLVTTLVLFPGVSLLLKYENTFVTILLLCCKQSVIKWYKHFNQRCCNQR